MNKRNTIIAIVCIVLLIGAAITFRNMVSFNISSKQSTSTTDTSVRFVSSTITADGIVTAQTHANLNFPVAGKLVYLPFKEGDTVKPGQIIAQLDTYQLQRQLTQSLNLYKISRNNFDQNKQNQNNGVMTNEQQTALKTAGAGLAQYGSDSNSTNYINDVVKRLADQNQATLDNSVLNVELANYALQMSMITSPIQGIITRQDVLVPGINITPSTTFSVADPESMVFRANIPTENIYYIKEGSSVTLAIDGLQRKITGSVLKIYPSKVTLPNGQTVYQVDIASDEMKRTAKLDMAGTAMITTGSQNVALVPVWTVLSGKYIWVDTNGTPQLKQITVGKIHGNDIEVMSGLSQGDKIIVDPQYITVPYYTLL